MKTKKVILITGASSGIGKDAALRLLKEGHIVYGGARRVNMMQDIVEAGGHIIDLDVTKRASISQAAQRVISEQQRIDVLWNNAGYGLFGAVEDVTYEEVVNLFEVNLFGLAELTKAVLPQMRKQRSGTIVNTSSMAGRLHVPTLGPWYHASKFALEGWSDCLRLELAPFNIDVVLIEPGAIDTEFENAFGPLKERSKGGPYEEVANLLAAGVALSNEKPGSLSPPSVISDVMVKIINARKPKTRYVAGKYAKTMLWMKRLFPGKTYDKLITTLMYGMFRRELKKAHK